MPWSDWQDPFDVHSTASTLQLRYRTGAGGVLIGSDVFESSYLFDGLDYGYTIVGYQYRRPSNWATFRTFPYPMFDMTEGVDYIEVPDQPGVYYEYQDEPNTFLRWDVPPVVLSVNNDPPAARPFQLLMEPETTYQNGDSLVFDPDRGSPVGAWNGSTPEGTVIATPNPGLASSFSLWPSLPQPFDLGEPNGYDEYLSYIAVWVYTRLPRWRYWKPESTKKPPLRLRQRDDNLFLNAGRTRNRSSRQTTNRLRSYD